MFKRIRRLVDRLLDRTSDDTPDPIPADPYLLDLAARCCGQVDLAGLSADGAFRIVQTDPLVLEARGRRIYRRAKDLSHG